MDADVIVIGAGAAGLAAALRLAERSLRVIALEGRARAGGRVMWRSVGSVDVPAELGAEFIHGAAPETSGLLREAGLTKVETGDEYWQCSSDGELRLPDDDFTDNDIFEHVRSLAEDESVEAFLRRFERDPHMRQQAQRARAFVEGFEAADPALASARSIADELRTGVDSTSSRPVGSYAPLFEHLTAECVRAGVDLRLNTAVERIVWEPGDVTIAVRSEHAGTSTVRARCAVVTVPVGVLRQRGDATRLSFSPPLPAEKHAALRGLEMGHVVRVTLAFRTPFWEQVAEGRYRDAAFFRCEGGAFNAFWTQMPLRSRTIVAWAGGPRATVMDGTPAQERIDRARDAFGSMFGQRDLARRECEAGVTHDWSADPFACGAYSYVVAGAGAARAALGAPVDDTLFFAGEATSTDGQGGTVSGAFETGIRAANEAVRALELAGATPQIVP
jgi:monoamine oxidase